MQRKWTRFTGAVCTYIRSNNGAGIDGVWRTDLMLIGQSTSVKIDLCADWTKDEGIRRSQQGYMNTKPKLYT
jgi:hypothetical protein